MAKIQIDFDQVMRFGDLHGDIGRSVHSHRAAFRHDSARLDQIIDAFGLQRTTGSPHFQGLTVAAAMGDADARAGRVADSLIKTSSRIFNHAGSFRDDKFNWAGAAFGAVGVALVGPFGTALLGSMGGELAGAASAGLVLGRRVSPVLGPLLPVFSGVVGVLELFDGMSGLFDPDRDGWSTISSSLKIAAGGIGVVAGAVGLTLVIGLGVGAAAPFVAIAAPFLLAGAVLSFGALMIDERETVARISSGAGRAASNAFRAAATTSTEAVHDVLGTIDNVWDGAVGLVSSASRAVVDAAFSGVEAIHSALKRATSEVGEQPWVPLAASGAIAVLSPAAGLVALGLALSGSGSSASSGSESPVTASPASTRPTRSNRLDSAEARRSALMKQGTYLNAAPGAHQRLPGAFRRAHAWHEELMRGDPTAEDVAAFESYMAMIKLADSQVAVVRLAAEHAYEQFIAAGEAGASVAGTAASIIGDAAKAGGEDAAKTLANYVVGEVVDLGTDIAGDAYTSELVGRTGLDVIGADAVVAHYVLDADQLLLEMESDFRRIDRVGHSDPYSLAKLQYDQYDGMRDAAADRGLLADSFSPITGDGSVVDSTLRSGLKIIGGPAAKATLDGLGIVGGTTKASYHIESGSMSLQVASSGLDSLRSAARPLLD